MFPGPTGDCMFKRLKNIRLRGLLSHMIVTLAYPAVKAYMSESHRLLVFTDSMPIIAAVLVVGGIIYSAFLHGDFDISAFVIRRGIRRDAPQDFRSYKAEKEEKREEAFNYPLFLGIIYLAAAAVIAWVFL